MPTIHELFQMILRDQRYMELEPPLSAAWQKAALEKQGLRLPAQYRELLSCFDGGELYIPGTVLYGLASPRSLERANSPQARELWHIPADYVIIGRLNYGDLLCIQSEEPGRVMIWDHEKDEEACSWPSLALWLEEEIRSCREQLREDEAR